MSPAEEIAAFLFRHFGGPLLPGEQVEVRCLHPLFRGKSTSRFTGNYAEAARYALEMRDEWNVYYGVNPRRDGIGKKNGVTRIVCLHADVDVGPAALFPDTGAAFKALAGIVPTLDVALASGNGLHGYWLLRQPALATPETNRLAEERMRAIYRALGGTDRVQDVSRILRLPRTINHKNGTETKVVYG